MTEFSRMSPVAQVRYLQRQNAQMADALKKAAIQSFKLRQEVTGGLQIVWALANQQPDKKLTIPAVELVAAMGSLKRTQDAESDTYTFEALQPTDEQHETLAKEIAGEPALTVTDEASEIPQDALDAASSS